MISHGNIPERSTSRNPNSFMLALLVLMLFFLIQPPGSIEASETVDDKYPGLATGILKMSLLADLPENVLVTSQPAVINKKELLSLAPSSGSGLDPGLEKNLFFLLEQELTKRILLFEAKAARVARDGLNDSQIIGVFLNAIAAQTEVSDQETRAFYTSNKKILGEASYTQVKDIIRQMLLQEKKQIRVQNFIQTLSTKQTIVVDRAWAEKQYALSMDNPVDKARKSGIPTMVEFGATGCIPCDKMQPILENLKKKYGSRLQVIFVHVREQQILGARYGIRVIPVQVFFDAQGREVFRHKGFFPEDKIITVLENMGVSYRQRL